MHTELAGLFWLFKKSAHIGAIGLALSCTDAAAMTSSEIESALKRGDYDTLIRTYQTYQQLSESGQISANTHGRYLGAFSLDRADFEDNFNQFVEKSGKHAIAYLGRGIYFQGRAWAARGGEYASKTSAQKFAQMDSYISKANADLEQADKLLASCDQCLSRRINMARADCRRNVAESLLAEALRRNPSSIYPPRAFVNFLEPKWCGKAGEAGRFIEEFASKYPTSPVLNQLRSILMSQKADQLKRAGSIGEAAEAYLQAVSLNSERTELLVESATLMNKQSRYQEALELIDLTQAAGVTSRWSRETRAWSLLQLRRVDEAIEELQLAIDQGSDWATQQLTAMWANGARYGNKSDLSRALELCKQAVERSQKYGFLCTAEIYARGKGVAVDLAKAVEWYHKGAQAGQLDCMFELGTHLWAGSGTAQNKREAAKWWLTASEGGNERSNQRLAEMNAWDRFQFITFPRWWQSYKLAQKG
jgi:TPR repeat protein